MTTITAYDLGRAFANEWLGPNGDGSIGSLSLGHIYEQVASDRLAEAGIKPTRETRWEFMRGFRADEEPRVTITSKSGAGHVFPLGGPAYGTSQPGFIEGTFEGEFNADAIREAVTAQTGHTIWNVARNACVANKWQANWR